jgi:hypothetical protein
MTRAYTATPIDDHAPTFDVADTLVVKVDAEPAAVGAALEHLDLTASAAAALSAFGGVDHVALAPALLAAQPGPELVFGLVWRYEGPTETIDPASVQTFDTPGHVKVIWDLSVQPDALEGAWLSMTRRFAATDETTRARLLDGWGIIGTVADSSLGESSPPSRRTPRTGTSHRPATGRPSVGSMPLPTSLGEPPPIDPNTPLRRWRSRRIAPAR